MTTHSFNCLEATTDIFGKKVLEASAGTGKTFAIEHITTRLILQGITLEKILIVTFTNLATDELKERIRKAIENSINLLAEQDNHTAFSYLLSYYNDKKALARLKAALYSFDECQIFTIHKFCHRMIKEFCFEARIEPFHLDVLAANKLIRKGVKDFLKYRLDFKKFYPAQISCLFNFKDFDQFIQRLSDEISMKPSEDVSFFTTNTQQEIIDLFQEFPKDIEYEKLLEDFSKISINYKKTGFYKEDFPFQVKLLSEIAQSPEDASTFDKFLSTKCTIFNFLKETNQKAKVKELKDSLHYPTFFSKLQATLKPIIDKLLDKKLVLQALVHDMQPYVYKKLKEADLLQPDDFLHLMQKFLQDKSFKSSVQAKYQAAIIDEFQDTDPVQWDIFKGLFLESTNICSLYLVGDPKQSIYGFRNADIYTYLQAVNDIGQNNLYRLDTNFRSTPELIHSLNTFFSSNWLYLPRQQKSLVFHPVKSGADIRFEDEHKPLHFMLANEIPQIEEALFFPYISSEIKRLYKVENKYSSFAILVKDRFQEQKLQSFFQKVGIPCKARMEPLKDSLGFKLFMELLDAILHPMNPTKVKIALASLGFSENEFSEELHAHFFQYHQIQLEKGLEKCLAKLIYQPLKEKCLQQRLSADELTDFFECIDLYLSKFKQNELTKQSLRDFAFYVTSHAAGRIVSSENDAVEIVTIHKSKGLEYEIVFCLGLSFASKLSPFEKQEKEEMEAEKLRQQYVAMTRGKKKVYLPFIFSNKEKNTPMNLFFKSKNITKDNLIDYLNDNAQSYSYTNLEPIDLKETFLPTQKKLLFPFDYEEKFVSSRKILSFSSVATKAPVVFSEKEDDLPSSSKTGVIIHEILEKAIFKESISESWIEKVLQPTHLKGYEKQVFNMANLALTTPLFPLKNSLYQMNKETMYTEVEFLYSQDENFMKGFIDVVFLFQEKVYIIDWKTNHLSDYAQTSLENAMKLHDYHLQKKIYAQALKKVLHSENKDFENHFGGVFYIFLRGLTQGQGIYFSKDIHT
ncbi:MAG: hypothetical protein COT84_00115 [Chlamydiae bacterium CG10_big_fil_rev_8_21_14_0_10_35_9]|nr:MAG: hypothetical protein COT84_00115 [Chlamydiae bacterium CG10_big_fil_rev_8_21_14_0_10_35_9]